MSFIKAATFSIITTGIIVGLLTSWSWKGNAQTLPNIQIIDLNYLATSTPPGSIYKIIDIDPLYGTNICYMKIGTGIFCK